MAKPYLSLLCHGFTIRFVIKAIPISNMDSKYCIKRNLEALYLLQITNYYYRILWEP